MFTKIIFCVVIFFLGFISHKTLFTPKITSVTTKLSTVSYEVVTNQVILTNVIDDYNSFVTNNFKINSDRSNYYVSLHERAVIISRSKVYPHMLYYKYPLVVGYQYNISIIPLSFMFEAGFTHAFVDQKYEKFIPTATIGVGIRF